MTRSARASSLAAGALATGLMAGLVTGCSGADAGAPGRDPRPAAVSGRPVPDPTPASATPSPAASAPADAKASAPPQASPDPPRPAPEPRRSLLSIPALGLDSVPVVRYPGSPDDAEGTRIQDRGPAASPRGRGGGVGPGEVGNFIVTAHRTSHSAPFRDLPALRSGDRVRVQSGRVVHVYRITDTRRTSFRSPRSLAEQSAAVPGRPGARPVRAMITLSTCATPEDHAAGNFWSDRFGNPEHRIDKVGVLVRSTEAGG